jgi:hypothetical protein
MSGVKQDNLNRKQRMALARKKAKLRNTIIAIVCVLVALALVALLVFNTYQKSKIRVYTNDQQTITLNPDGTFSAALAHSELTGTYAETDENGVITVTFTMAGTSVTANIEADVMTLPEEWDDGHDHGMTLPLK